MRHTQDFATPRSSAEGESPASEGPRGGLSVQLRSMNYAQGRAAVSPVQMDVGDGSSAQDNGGDDAGNPTLVNDYQRYDDLYQGGQSGVLFAGPPRPHDVIQRAQYLSDCWLVGTMSALAAANPGYIQNDLMQQSGDNVTVNLFFARRRSEPVQSVPIQISLSELPVHDNDEGQAEPAYSTTHRKSKSGKSVLWVVALEMAVAKLFTQMDMKPENAELGGDYLRLSPGSASFGMLVLTGKWPASYGRDKRASEEDREERAESGKTPIQELYTTESGDVKDLPPAVVAARLKRSLRNGQPVTAVMDGHVVPVLSATGGPEDGDVEQWLMTPTKTLKDKNSAAMDGFTLTYYNENKPAKGDIELKGWEEIHGTFELGFRFGSVPG